MGRVFCNSIAGLLCAASLGAASCGFIESTSLKWQAEARIGKAEKLGADRFAPYEMTAARAYLHKGKEEAGYADFEAAIDYLHKARLLAKQAEEKAEAASKLEPLLPRELQRPAVVPPSTPARPAPPAQPERPAQPVKKGP